MEIALDPMAALPSYLADNAFDALYAEQVRVLVGMAWALLGDQGAAEDIVHEAFIRVRTAWPRLRDPERAAAYLRSIVLNLSRSSHRHRLVVARHPESAPPDSGSAEEQAVLREDQREVLAAVRQLSRRQRDCVVLRYYAELADAEIAQTLSISINSVKTHLARGLHGLEVLLESSR